MGFIPSVRFNCYLLTGKKFDICGDPSKGWTGKAKDLTGDIMSARGLAIFPDSTYRKIGSFMKGELLI